MLSPWMCTLQRDGSRVFGKAGSWVLKTKGISSIQKNLYALQRVPKGLPITFSKVTALRKRRGKSLPVFSTGNVKLLVFNLVLSLHILKGK